MDCLKKQTDKKEPEFRDEELFRTLELRKKKKKRRIIEILIITFLLMLAGGFFGVKSLRKKVNMSVLKDDSEVTSYEAKRGSLSTTVSGYGTLVNVEEEQLEIPAGVVIAEILVDANNTVKKGDVLATVESASVLDAMNSLQNSISEIDAKLEAVDDGGDSVYVQSGLSGRVKKIYAEIGEAVTDCIYDHGALALLSLDGYMACDIETSDVSAGEMVEVRYGDGKSESGRVEKTVNHVATIIISDAYADYGAEAEIFSAKGEKIGAGVLYIHSPLRITAVSGEIYSLNVKENDSIYSGSVLMSLKNAEFSAEYQYMIKQRSELEEDFLTLNELRRNGAVLAPYDGTIISVDYDEDAAKTTTTVTYYDNYSTASTVDNSKEAIPIVTMSPDIEAETTITVDESNILSLELGQTADVTISSIGEDIFKGTVTKIDKTASSSSGVTKYSAVITFAKIPQMLTGMTTSVTIRIQGVDNAVIIPVDALHQTSSSSYVYTSYNEETHEYGEPVMVETGLSNSSFVEIISGLAEGMTVYYVEEEDNAFGFPDFRAGMSGEMPGGGFSGGIPGGERPGGGRTGGGRTAGGMQSFNR